MHHSGVRGFTLIEMTIALVIISLISVVVLTARETIRSAAIASFVKEEEALSGAIKVFELRYRALPGDFSEASRFWPGETNGNGNGRIASPAEDLLAWRHLALSGNISGTYTGVAGATNRYVAGVNMPASTMDSGIFWLATATIYGKTGVLIEFSSIRGTGGKGGGILTSQETQRVDEKADDGAADRGKIFASNASGMDTCTTADQEETPPSNYTNDDSDTSCVMWFFY